MIRKAAIAKRSAVNSACAHPAPISERGHHLVGDGLLSMLLACGGFRGSLYVESTSLRCGSTVESLSIALC